MCIASIKKRQLQFECFELKALEQEAIEYIRANEPPEGYFVGFSGGKDSIVTYDLVKRAGVKHKAFYSCTGIDYPQIYKFIKQHYAEVTWLKPKESFFKSILRKAPPTRKARWCCDELKKNPSKHIPLKSRIMGIRAEESSNRKKRGRESTFSGVTHIKPIFHWQEWAVWEYIEAYKLAYPSLYDEGFQRIGCVVCPMVRRTIKTDTPIGRAFYNTCKDWHENHRTEQAKEKYKHQTFEMWWDWYVSGRKLQ